MKRKGCGRQNRSAQETSNPQKSFPKMLNIQAVPASPRHSINDEESEDKEYMAHEATVNAAASQSSSCSRPDLPVASN
jgi:hypothetical protein